MLLSALECICEALEYICKKIHDILSQKHREKEGDILFHVCMHTNIHNVSVRVECTCKALECIARMYCKYTVKCGRMHM